MPRTNFVKAYGGKRACQHQHINSRTVTITDYSGDDTSEIAFILGANVAIESVDSGWNIESAKWTDPASGETLSYTSTDDISINISVDSDTCGLTKGKHSEARDDHAHEGGNLTCQKCQKPINIGDPYKYVKQKLQRGGIKRDRCMDCPNWKASELTSSAFLSTIYAADEDQPEPSSNPDSADIAESEIEDLKTHFAAAARAAAEIRTEAADNMEEGFGHETSMSSELREQGEHAESIADEIENLSFDFSTTNDLDDEDLTDEDREESLAELADLVEAAVEEIQSTWSEVQM